MTKEYDNKTGYSIPRSYKPVVTQTATMVVVSDALLLITLLLFVAFRNAVGIDSSMVALAVILFFIKALLTGFSVYKMIKSWLGITYFVVNNRLYIQSDVRSINSMVFNLKDISKAVTNQSYILGSRQDYGTIIITFSRGVSVDEIQLKGVKDPDNVAKMLSMGGK